MSVFSLCLVSDALLLEESLNADDVSSAWLVWSRAAEAALADAYRFSGGPPPFYGSSSWQGVVLRFVLSGFGEHPVRKARGNVADVHDAADVFLYRDASIAPVLEMRRRFKAVMFVLAAMIRYGISLARSGELTAQSDKILAVCPLYPVTIDDLNAVQGLGIGDFHRVVADVRHRLIDFIHAVVVHRRDEATGGWRRTPWCIPKGWLRLDLVPPAPFLQCQPHLTPGGSGVLADPARIDKEFRKAWLRQP